MITDNKGEIFDDRRKGDRRNVDRRKRAELVTFDKRSGEERRKLHNRVIVVKTQIDDIGKDELSSIDGVEIYTETEAERMARENREKAKEVEARQSELEAAKLEAEAKRGQNAEEIERLKQELERKQSEKEARMEQKLRDAQKLAEEEQRLQKEKENEAFAAELARRKQLKGFQAPTIKLIKFKKVIKKPEEVPIEKPTKKPKKPVEKKEKPPSLAEERMMAVGGALEEPRNNHSDRRDNDRRSGDRRQSSRRE